MEREERGEEVEKIVNYRLLQAALKTEHTGSVFQLLRLARGCGLGSAAI